MTLVLNDLVEEVLSTLRGVTDDRDVLGTLAADITDTDTTIPTSGPAVGGASGFSPGRVEIGEEVVYVQAVDQETGELQGVLRGQEGTAPVAHVTGEMVRDNPQPTRHKVRQAINTALQLPWLYGTKETTATVTNSPTVELPENAISVQSVRVDAQHTWGRPATLRHWEFDNLAATDSGVALHLHATQALIGHTIRVRYRCRPAPMTSLADDFATTTGLPDYVRLVIVYGALKSLTAGWEATGYQASSVPEQMRTDRAQLRGINVSRHFANLWAAEVEQAREQLAIDAGVTINYKGW